MNGRSLLLCLVLLAILPTQVRAESTFGIEQYLALKKLYEVSVSPDGNYVAYTLSENDLKKDAVRTSVWMQATSGDDPVLMTNATSNASSPKWSPDGKYLAVISNRKDETSQVFLLDRRGGDAQSLTKFKQGVNSFSWSPDGKKMLVLANDLTPADLDEEKRPNPRPYVIDRLQFKEDYIGYLDRYRTHVYVVTVADQSTRQVTFGDFDDSEPAWAPDSQRIAFVSNRTITPDRNRNSDIWIVDASKESSNPVQLTSAETADASPSWSPDGRSIVYTSTTKDVISPVYAIPQLTIIEIASRKRELINSLDEIQVFAPRYSSDGSALLAITEDRGEQNLVRVDIATGTANALVKGANTVYEFDSGTANERLYTVISTPRHPSEIYTVEDNDVKRLSFVTQTVLEGVTTANIKKFSYRSKDGTEIETLVAFPPNYKKRKKYPGLLYIHGGPQAQFNYEFNYEAQLLAAQGYVVVMPNPRGSFGYGQKFASAIYQDWGGIDYEDVVASMDFAIDQGWVNKDLTAVYGWSYGGIMTNNVITKTNRFKAAITGASATLYVANYGHDQYQRWWEEELGLPWEAQNREKWDRISPFYSLDKVTTPTLIVGGEKDWNVPIINSEQLYIALKRQEVPTQLVVYPGEGHGLSVPSYEKDLYERYFEWLKKYVKK